MGRCAFGEGAEGWGQRGKRKAKKCCGMGLGWGMPPGGGRGWTGGEGGGTSRHERDSPRGQGLRVRFGSARVLRADWGGRSLTSPAGSALTARERGGVLPARKARRGPGLAPWPLVFHRLVCHYRGSRSHVGSPLAVACEAGPGTASDCSLGRSSHSILKR